MHGARALLALACLLCSARGQAEAAAQPAAAWLLARGDAVIGEYRADAELPIASLAKLLTALLWLQKPDRLEQTVTISAKAAAATGARAGLRAGEQYRGADLLSAMLVRSANDACIALAEQAAGSVDAFVADLSRAATVLGLEHTRLANPCGLDAADQHSTAREVLLIARSAMELPGIRSRVALRTFTLRSVDGSSTHTLRNTNLLLDQLPGTEGVKTGFTARAGKCLVALVRRDGVEVWLVLLGARERWWTAHRTIEAVFTDASAPR